MKTQIVYFMLLMVIHGSTYCKTSTTGEHSLEYDDKHNITEDSRLEILVKEPMLTTNISLIDPEQLTTTRPTEAEGVIDSTNNEELSRGHGNKQKKKKKIKKQKLLKKILPLLMIPILIQSAIIPLIVMKLKLLVLKAIAMGKLSIILVALNFIYTTFISRSSENKQGSNFSNPVDSFYNTNRLRYVKQIIALCWLSLGSNYSILYFFDTYQPYVDVNEHYGYNGGIEFGALINRRRDEVMTYRNIDTFYDKHIKTALSTL